MPQQRAGEWSPQGPAADDFARKQVRDLAEFSAGVRVPTVATGLVISGLAWTGGVHWAIVLAWLVAVVVVKEIQVRAMPQLVQADLPTEERLRRAVRSKLPVGIVHGGSALFMLALGQERDALLTMILMSWSAGAVATTFMVPRAYAIYAASYALPTAAMWFLSGTWIGWSVGTLALMFFGVQLRYARINYRMYLESYRMRLENLELLRDLSEQRQRLAQARDAAMEADLAKSRFLASASHDLRQPLQSLSLNSGALSRLPLAGEAQAISADMRQSIEVLRQMLDGLLDVSKLDAGEVKPTMRRFALQRVLEGLCARFQSAARAKGLQLQAHCAEDLQVMSDADLLGRLLSNLIDNAIKFTAAGGITLSAGVEADAVRLTVADTGPGIDPGDRYRIFDDLVQLGNPQRDRVMGTGLGLGIVRRIATTLSIRYEVESGDGQGTRFHLWLPLEHGDGAVIGDQHAVLPTLVARRVLVLDDDAAVRDAYRRLLDGHGCQCACAASLQEALGLLDGLEPEIALVDYRLPGGRDGLQAIEGLRASRPGLAAVIVSADTSVAMRERAAQMAVPVLRKPVTDVVLATAVNEALLASDRRLPAGAG
ncbi:ATP-binding protein [Pseudorhodoferax sp.]|uniref:ATP-binding response regulator n=1 Tax=Pseudorhodoferax sp. TaxID=1993553 RepID=UPI0039E4F7AC